MASVPNLSAATSGLDALSNLLLITPKTLIGYNPQAAPTKDGQQPAFLPSLVFNYEGENTATIESDITDHYTEDNQAIQDQIALKPEIITVTGFVGELNDIIPELLLPLKLAVDKLTPLSAYTPQLTITALLALQQASFLYANAAKALQTAVSAWSTLATAVSGGTADTIIGSNGIVADGSVQNKQQLYFQQFYGYWRERRLFTIQTPWAVFDNMAIMSVRAIQGEETRVISDFELRFKKIRFASTQTTPVVGLNSRFMQGRASVASASKVNLGVTLPPAPFPPVSQSSSISLITGG